jgi:hypothetical protein
VTHFPPLWPLEEVPLDAVLLEEVVLDDAASPPPAGAGCGLYSALYAVGLEPMMPARLWLWVPYVAVSLLLTVLGTWEHPAIPNKDALAVIQNNR